MFYEDNNGGEYKGLSNFVDNMHYVKDNEVDFCSWDKKDMHSSERLNDILKFYEMHEGYVKNLVSEFKTKRISSIGLEDQILELFNNVRSLLIKGDKDLMKNCIESILKGRENALRFIDDQKNYIDSDTLRIMNTIISEYSHHINYLNEAINIL